MHDLEELQEAEAQMDALEAIDRGRRGAMGIAYHQAINTARNRLKLASILQREAEEAWAEAQRRERKGDKVEVVKTGVFVQRLMVYRVLVGGLPVAILLWWDYEWRVVPLKGEERWTFRLLSEAKEWCSVEGGKLA